MRQTIGSVLWGLAVWALGTYAAGWIYSEYWDHPAPGLPFWRLIFIVGYAGYLHGLAQRRAQEKVPSWITEITSTS